jgi:drug/metabolite transporter (DMT)-like permease
MSTKSPKSLLPIVLALATLYLVWGGTYLAIRIAIDGFPPLLMVGMRFLIAGSLLYLYLTLRGAPRPGVREWRGAAVTGILLLAGGNGGVTVAEQWVASGLASLVICTVPLWAVLFGMIWGHRPGVREWAGLFLGLLGVGILNLEGNFRASPIGAAVLLGAAMVWSFGSILSKRLTLPSGLMSSACQMLCGGLFMALSGLLIGERLSAAPPLRSVVAFLYLVVFGSLVGFSCYLWLLERVRPALATSYAYVNPVVAVILGTAFAGERLGRSGLLGMAVILSGVILVATSGWPGKRIAQHLPER